jgi:hypothetical protein
VKFLYCAGLLAGFFYMRIFCFCCTADYPPAAIFFPEKYFFPKIMHIVITTDGLPVQPSGHRRVPDCPDLIKNRAVQYSCKEIRELRITGK